MARYMAGYRPRTHRKAVRVPNFAMSQGMKVGCIATLKMASVRKMIPIVRVSRLNPLSVCGKERIRTALLALVTWLEGGPNERNVPMTASEDTL